MRTRILVVDDYAYNRLIYGEWLGELAGVEVVEAATAQRALQLAESDSFALFVIDAAMPDLSGVELTARLRRVQGCRNTPVIIVTTEPTEHRFMTSAYHAGASDFLPSATTRGTVLQQKAAVFLELHRQREALAARLRELERKLGDAERDRDELRTRATHDPLTKLPNRILFRDRLQAACARATRNRATFAVAYLDLDGFKAINDRHGHAVGDALLAAVATRLAQTVRASDSIARLGGDEFGVLLEGVDVTTAEHVTRKIHRVLMQPYDVKAPGAAGQVTLLAGCSLGLAIYPEHATELDRLVFRADMAMYAAKEEGGGVRVYGDELLQVLPEHEAAFRATAPAKSLERH